MTTPDLSGPETAREWLIEHLKFTVPVRMIELDHTARNCKPHPWNFTYEEELVRIFNQEGRMLDGVAGLKHPQGSIPALLGALGDAMFGQSKPGRAGAVAGAMATGLAVLALTSDTGAAYAGLHWCRGTCIACAPVVDGVGQVAA